MKHIKVLALVGLFLAAGACSVSEQSGQSAGQNKTTGTRSGETLSLEDQFLANFNGYSKMVTPDGDILPIEDGGRTLLPYRFVAAQSATQARYRHISLFFQTAFWFPVPGMLSANGVIFTLTN